MWITIKKSNRYITICNYFLNKICMNLLDKEEDLIIFWVNKFLIFSSVCNLMDLWGLTVYSKNIKQFMNLLYVIHLF